MEDQATLVASIQDRILQQLQEAKIPVGIYLKNGIRLQGIISGFDAHVVILYNATIHQMIYKHAISTLAPQRFDYP